MKCVKKIHTDSGNWRVLKKAPVRVVRVLNHSAWKMVKSGRWEYCPKSEWKENGRRYL